MTTTKPAMTDTSAIVASVEAYLSSQYADRHVQAVDTVRGRWWDRLWARWVMFNVKLWLAEWGDLWIWLDE